jgi:hypothetical protein
MGVIGVMVILRGGRCRPIEFGWLDGSGLLASRRCADCFCAPCRYSDQGALLLVMILSDF